MDVYQQKNFPKGTAEFSVPAEQWISLLPALTRFTARTGKGIQQFGETTVSGEDLRDLVGALTERGNKTPLANQLQAAVKTAIEASEGLVFIGT